MTCLRRIGQDEDGFSLVELLTAMIIGSVILWALMTLMTTGLTKSVEVSDRSDAAATGRSAMDRAVTLIDSSLCLDPIASATAISPLIGAGPANPATVPMSTAQGSDSNYVAFYADLSGVSTHPDKYTITYDPTAKTLTERRFDAIGNLPTVTYSTTPTRVSQLAPNVVPARDPVTNAQLPIFRYYRFETNGSINMNAPMATPIAQASAGTAVRVQVAFKVISSRTKKEDRRATTIEGQSALGTPDPNTPNAGSCP